MLPSFLLRRIPPFLLSPQPWVALGLGLLITLVSWHFIRQNQAQAVAADFKLRTDRASEAIHARLLTYELALRGGVGLFGATDSVTRSQWRTYVDKLKLDQSFPGIQGVGFSKVLYAADKATHVADVRAEGFHDYDIQPTGLREVYTSIIYLEPFSGRNLQAFGYDMFSEPTRRTAMEQARDTGVAAISGKVKLVQETEEKPQAGILMYLPVYRSGRLPEDLATRRANILGYVYAPFRMNDLMTGLLDTSIDGIDVEIFDAVQPQAEALLFDRHDLPHEVTNNDTLSRLTVLQPGGRVWSLRYQTTPAFQSTHSNGKPNLVMGAGSLISLLLFGLTAALSRTRNQSVTLAVQTTASAKEMEQRFSVIFHSAMDAIITIDDKQHILHFNPAAERIFGCTAEEAIGSPLERFMPERFRGAHRLHVDRFGATGVSDRQMGKQRALYGLRANGDEFPLEASISQATVAGKRLFTVILHDITARAQAETALRTSEQRFRVLVEGSPDAIYIQKDETIVFVNQATLTLFGATSTDQLIGRPVTTLFHADSHQSLRDTLKSIAAGNPRRPLIEHKIIRLDGAIRYVRIASSVFDDAGTPAIQEIMRDVTDHYLTMAELERSHAELRRLGMALETAQEEERKRIARELHDDLGQTLTVLKMDVSSLKAKLNIDSVSDAAQKQLHEDIERMDGLLNHTVQSVRRISADLRPLLLDELGLAIALEALVKHVMQRSQHIRFRLDLNADRLQVDQRVATPLYRIAQEALNNTVKHSEATEATLRLYRNASDDLIMEFSDNGKGMAPADRRKLASFGLIGMRERVLAVGGEIVIEGNPGMGTRIRVRIPNTENDSQLPGKP